MIDKKIVIQNKDISTKQGVGGDGPVDPTRILHLDELKGKIDAFRCVPTGSASVCKCLLAVGDRKNTPTMASCKNSWESVLVIVMYGIFHNRPTVQLTHG